MINIKKIILYVLFIFTLTYICFAVVFDKSTKYEENKNIIGKIVYIKNKYDKTIFDIKSDKKYRVTTYDDFNYELGDIISVNGTFKTPSNNTVPDLFNYRKYLLSKKIAMISSNPNVKFISKNNHVIYKIKNNMIKRANKYKSNSYIKTFIMGDTSSIEDEILENYRNIGISHLLAISGMHVSIFLIVINFIFKKIKYKNIIILLFLMFLLFITNYPESLIRCTLFMILKYINNKFKLKYSNIEILIFTFCFLIVYNPYFIYSIGFMFSFVITFFILISNKLYKDKNYFIKISIISIISFLASIPLIANSFFKINLLTPIFNMIFVPIISIIIFPLGLITFILPIIDNIYYIITNGMEEIINILSNIRIFTFTISKPNIMVIFIYYLILYISIKVNRKYMFLYILILLVNINSRFFIINQNITFLDVGQGDSSVIILHKGKTIIIDTGGIYNSNYSIALNKMIPYLNSKGISKIDLLILTHGDFDHMGEAINLVNNIKIEKVIFNSGPYNDLENELIIVLNKKKIPYYSCIKELNIDKNKLYFLQTKEYDNENDNSNVIITELDGYKFMFMGDASITTEKEIISKYKLPDIDVLKAGHHGSKTSSSIEFIDKINPKYSIISVGNNRYGHPNKEVLDNLDNSKIYRTDQDGSIMIKIKNNKLKIETCSP